LNELGPYVSLMTIRPSSVIKMRLESFSNNALSSELSAELFLREFR